MEFISEYKGEASTFEDPSSEDENEDTSRAIELSLLEANRTGTSSADVESSYTDDDEQLDGAIQESVKFSDKSRQRVINTGTGRTWWKKISTSLNFKKFDVTSRTSSTWERSIDYQMNLLCDVCDEPAVDSDRLTGCCYWGQTVCLKHKSDGTPFCCSCSRFKLGNTRYINLSDGRKLCPDCHCTAIMDMEKCIPLFHEVYRFFEGLNMKIIRDIPIFLVDQHEMKRLEGDKKSPTLGMTTYEVQVITSVVKSSQRGQNIEVLKEVQYLSRRNEVTSMLLLYGYPKLDIGSTLAHEMMHAWMRVEGYRGVRKEVEEGICEVMAHRWLDCHAFIGDDFLYTSTPEQAQFLRNLKEVLKNRIEKNHDKIYGGGFRDAKWAVERYGLKYTMNHIAHTGKFPQ